MTREKMWEEFESQLKREVRTPITMSYDDSIRIAEMGIKDVVKRWKKRLEQEPCDDCISRQAVLDAMYELCDTGKTLNENPWRDNPHIDAIVDAINNLPPVTPQQKTGHWIRVDKYKLKCSKCEVVHFIAQYPQSAKINYCPNCGAKMVESEE